MQATVLPSGNVRITLNLASLVVSRDEAEAARTDPAAAAALLRRLEALR